MELNEQIRKYRGSMGLSQEELAEKIYVSRQTISNWETGKSYPDIHSLLLLSAVFGASLDQLIKGDVEAMKKEIKAAEVKALNRDGAILGVLMLLMVISALPLVKWLGWFALCPWGLIVGVTLYVALRIERVKKENDIFTYKEIVAFIEGKRLDELSRQREIGKRPYQRLLLFLASGAIAFAVCVLLGRLIL